MTEEQKKEVATFRFGQGHFPARYSGSSACRRGDDDRRRRVFRRRRLSEGRPATRRPHHDGLADLRARDHDARIRHGAGGPAACARAERRRHPQRHRRRGLEPGDRPDPGADLQRAADRHARRNDGAAERLGLDAEPRRAAVRRRLAPDAPEGARPAARRAARSRRRAAQLALLGSGESGAGVGLRRRRREPSRRRRLRLRL